MSRVAHGGLQAMGLLFSETGDKGAEELPLLILWDIELPKLNGLSMTMPIRQHPGSSYIPVMMLSSSDHANDLSDTHRLGASDHLRNPVSALSLYAALSVLVDYWCEFHKQAGKAN